MAVARGAIVRIPARYTRARYTTVIAQVAVTASGAYLARNRTEDAALPEPRLNPSALRAIPPRQMHEGQKYFKNKAVGIGRLVWQWTLRVGWRCNGKKFARGE